MPVFDQRGQQSGVQFNILSEKDIVAIFRSHRDKYKAALEAAVLVGDDQRIVQYTSCLAALYAFALEIGIVKE